MVSMVDDRQRQQRAKNRALLAVLLALVALFYVMTLVKMGVF
jgi:high-affinity K+ transport system ATPase subunit B